jgi:hypothetical protein
MNDSQWSLVVGASIVIVTRLVDVFLPKGYIARWVNKYLIKSDAPEDSEQDT